MEKDAVEAKKSDAALKEEAVLKFWTENKIFEKTLKKDAPKGEFVFFEGPPTANAKPALHHLEARAFKDVIPRYKTMQGFHVPRRGGWDTHGLPVELQIEKKLGLNSKKAIEEYGIEKFNAECKQSVFEYIKDWEDFTDRIGYWVDKKNAYFTFNNSYIESLWNVLAEVEKKDLLYKDYRVVPWCARCGTPLASHELAQGYEDVKDLSIFAKFPIKGFDKAYFVAWTTTPWTLPGNVALAVGKDIDYVEAKVGEEILVVAKERLSVITTPYEIVAEHKGSEMVGMEYTPLYNFITPNDKSYKVYAADFVTTVDGTGIVHIAPMYGADDFDLGNKMGLPKEHVVGLDGKFVANTGFFSGRFAHEKSEDGKPILAIDVIKDLQTRGLFFDKKNYEHTYPHCWRCKTPLIYYARDSWFIAVETLRDELVKENEKINWEPSHIKEGRFGEWLKGIKDWAISRERYWGTPLPIWMSEDGDRIVVDSIDTLRKHTQTSGNKYLAMRHGYGQHMINGGVVSSIDHDSYHLTDEGRVGVQKSAQNLKGKNITKIFASPLIRTRETANIVAETLGIPKESIVVDERIREYDFGDWDGKPYPEFAEYRDKNVTSYDQKLGETTLLEVKKRVGDFLYELESKYKNETILIVSHGIFFETSAAVLAGANNKDSLDVLFKEFKNNRIQPAEVRELDFIPLPHNQNYELDLHRPFIDSIVLEKDGVEYRRVKEVMDVWFDSGAMPFAQVHYPFEGQKGGLFKKDTLPYPADFISEAVDQTRGWFYTLHAVGVLMGRGRAYKNCICLGHILDAQGKKMSKSIGNIVNPWEMMDKYGVDTLRLWMYSVNQPGDSKNFDEKTVAELRNKVFNLFYNVLAFYELYRDQSLEEGDVKSENVLDVWIMARFQELVNSMTESLDSYKLLEPVRALREFIDDLSTWYLRRSRDRLKDGDVGAKKTLYYVLKNTAKLMAPFAPFAAEDIWQKLKNSKDAESVHLAHWPKAEKVEETVLSEMETVRNQCATGNMIRKEVAIPLKQPLATFFVKDVLEKYADLIKEELNVKEIKQGSEVSFDTNITPELKREGDFREFLRSVQGLRKDANLSPNELVILVAPESNKELIKGFEEELKKVAGVREIKFGGEETRIEK